MRSSSVSLSSSLKRKCRHFDEILITGCTGSCHFDNFQCSQWWKFHQNEDISVSVIRRSIIFTEHFLWHLIRVGKFPSMLNWFPACDVQMSIFPYISHDWLAWVLVITENDEKSKSGIFITQPMFITVLPYLPKIFASEGGKSQEFVKNISLCN